ncbi:MAG: hypothetical protein WCP07_01580 [bacterium]
MKLIGAFLGLVVFILGVALVADVFYQAYGIFNSAPQPVPMPTPVATPKAGTTPTTAATASVTASVTASATASATSAITASLIDFVKKIALLLLMCIAGAIIASQGSSLFFRSLAATPHPTPRPATPAPP